MDPELKALIKENLEVSKKNNALLKKIWGDVKWKRVYKIVYWGIIISLALGAYYYIQPIMESIGTGYGGVSETITAGFQNIKKVNELIPNLLEQTSNLGQ